MTRRLTAAILMTLAAVITASVVHAAEPKEIPITIENNRFSPEEIKVKAGEPFVLVVTNNDPKKSIEVENKDLRIEKVVPAGKTVKIRVRALKPGSYVFVDDFNQSAKFKVVAE